MTTTRPDVTTESSAVTPKPNTTRPATYALLGNPNTGKTTLFNRLCGIRSKTANFPGSTVEARIGQLTLDGRSSRLVDLPGIYGLSLERPESKVCREFLAGDIRLGDKPEAIVIVADATNLHRNLIFVSQALQQGLPAIVALNMSDLAAREGLRIDREELERQLGVPVVAVSARSGEGVDELVNAMDRPSRTTAELPERHDAHAASRWAEGLMKSSVAADNGIPIDRDTITDRLDIAFTHPLIGLVLFAAIMTGLFYTIFALATVPMDLIEWIFASLGGLVQQWVPAGWIRDLLSDGVIGGIAGTVVFLPQIMLLFFLISLLEDTGYLSRAAFVMDRLLRKFGLPGQAFVPLLSAHACAIPAIMSTRLIPDWRDRVATVLVIPFVSCSARLPVYTLLVGVLFVDRPLYAGIAFTGCYVLGALAALLSAMVFRRTMLKGPSRPMVLELPTYKLPSLRTALVTTLDRGWIFLRKAGTVILAICIVLWWLSSFPKADEPVAAETMRQEAAAIVSEQPDRAAALEQQADELASRHAVSRSFAGRIGHVIEPIFRPIGLDWQLSIGVVTSFAAREVFVSTMAVLLTGEDGEEERVLERIRTAERDDGTPVFTTATAASLLVFYVLAMQCLPTLAVTAREAGHWGWALLQLGYMSALAYICACGVHLGLTMAGVN